LGLFLALDHCGMARFVGARPGRQSRSSHISITVPAAHGEPTGDAAVEQLVGFSRDQARVNGLAALLPLVGGLTLAFDSQVNATQDYSAAG